MTVVSPAQIATQRWSALQKQQHNGDQPGTCNISLLGGTSSPATCTLLSKQNSWQKHRQAHIKAASCLTKDSEEGKYVLDVM